MILLNKITVMNSNCLTTLNRSRRLSGNLMKSSAMIGNTVSAIIGFRMSVCFVLGPWRIIFVYTNNKDKAANQRRRMQLIGRLRLFKPKKFSSIFLSSNTFQYASPRATTSFRSIYHVSNTIQVVQVSS